MRYFREWLVSLVIAVSLPACGGDNGGSDPPTTPTPPPSGQNPCAALSVEPEDGSATLSPMNPSSDKRDRVDGSSRWNVLDAIWNHRAAAARRQAPFMPLAVTQDVGDIAVLQDQGDLILPPNPFDLRSVGIRYSPNGSGGYNAVRIDAAFRTQLGNAVTLQDDDTFRANVPFPFRFFGRQQTVAFVNSDGNVTFEEGDVATTDRSISRVLTGPPRVAPFFADLDPSTGNGRILVRPAADSFTVTWCGVRGFESSRSTTVQTTLLPDGSVEMKFADNINLTDAVVAVSPGQTGLFTPIDLSLNGTLDGGSAAAGERFAQSGQLDLIATTRAFYRSHPDVYDQLVIWTDTGLTTDAFAFEVTVANEVRGIGLDLFDLSPDFGSGGTLRSLVNMDALGKYPDDPLADFLGENNTLSLMGQEAGHRWLAFLGFRDHTGARSEALLGRDNAHWSFFFNSDASVMEGNRIEDLGGGQFRTTAAVDRYSLLDQYAMGLVDESQVPPFFYVADPVNIVPFKTASSSPDVGVTFGGTRRDVLIGDVVGVMGPRLPPASVAAKVHRQAFLYVVGAGRSANPVHVEKINRFRREWETFFQQATSGRMRAITLLRPPT